MKKKHSSSYFSLYLKLFFGKCELYRPPFMHLNTIHISSYLV